MTLMDSVEMWEIQTGISGLRYLDDCNINEKIDKDALWNYLMFEYMDMKVVDSDSRFFHERVKNFFDVHKWNIDQLAETLEYEYDPLENSRWGQDETTTEHNVRDRDDNWQRKLDVDRTDDWQRNESIDKTDDWQRDETIEKTDDWQRDETIERTDNWKRDETIDRTDDWQRNDTIEKSDNWQLNGIIDKTDDSDRTYSENGKENATDVNLVSAYNQTESPELIGYDTNGNPIYKYNDEEHDRQTHSKSYSFEGDEHNQEQMHETHDEDKKEQIEETQEESKKEQINEIQTENKSEQTDETQDENKSEQIHETQDENKKEQISETQDEGKKEQIHETQSEDRKEQEDIVDDKKKDKNTTWHGNSGTSFQSLIEEQRKTVQFNIYKWIARHFSKELLIAVW